MVDLKLSDFEDFDFTTSQDVVDTPTEIEAPPAGPLKLSDFEDFDHVAAPAPTIEEPDSTLSRLGGALKTTAGMIGDTLGVAPTEIKPPPKFKAPELIQAPEPTISESIKNFLRPKTIKRDRARAQNIFAVKAITKEINERKDAISIPETTLAFRNNNPGNLRFANQNGAVEGEGGYARFATPDAGFKALQRQIELDASRGHDLTSFINKYAPPTENDTAAYIDFVEKETGTDRKTPLTNFDIDKVSKAMAKFESGSTFEGGKRVTEEEVYKSIGSKPKDYDPVAGAQALGRLVYDAPLNIHAAALSLTEDDNPEENFTAADVKRKEQEIRTAKRSAESQADKSKSEAYLLPFLQVKDITETSGSIGFTGVSMGAGVPGAALTAVGLPAAGVPLSMIGSGAAAFKQSKVAFTIQILLNVFKILKIFLCCN